MINEAANRSNKKTAIVSVAMLLLMGLTLCVGVFVLEDRSYYFTATVMMILAMVPFFTAFEQRKPQARELMVVAVMAALAIAGRAAFFMVPQFKPVVAIVVIAAVCLGAESGFLVGALTAFVSNFFFGQGPWTPWQMFCLGLIGFLAGLLFREGVLPRKRLPLCIFGAAAVIIIYGGIMDLASVTMWSPELTPALILTAYAAGLSFNLIHAAGTVVFLLLLAKPIIEKMERIKTKYGLLQK